MNERNFDEWFESFREEINTYDVYNNFEKCRKRVQKFENELNLLNALIYADDIEKKFASIIKKYPECLKAIPILLGVRGKEIFYQDINYRFDKKIQTINQYVFFMRETGLFDIIKTLTNGNLYDFAMGVETGKTAKNRKRNGNYQLKNLVEKYLIKSGVNYRKEIYLTEIEKLWNIDLSAISSEGTVNKRWDFAIKTENKVYVIETNFYASGGSKLNETARSYKMIAQEAKNINDFEFVWITDGKGWKSAKNNLQETFNVLENLYNIKDMENGIFDYL